MENIPKTYDAPTEGIIVFRNGRRRTVRFGNLIYFRMPDGTLDTDLEPEIITTKLRGDVLEVYDENNAKIGGKQIRSVKSHEDLEES